MQFSQYPCQDFEKTAANRLFEVRAGDATHCNSRRAFVVSVLNTERIKQGIEIRLVSRGLT